ncbi:hypothetical protein [Xenorhabdus entomophaga]|uniref:hypothetical protein n=1 Tax=Xenorhabdus entomophaga TaxID=3136257 RepID=UPI0030F4AB48
MSDESSIYGHNCQEILKNDLHIKLVRDYTNEPIANVPYTLTNNKMVHSGTSDSDGINLEKGLTSIPFTVKINPSESV